MDVSIVKIGQIPSTGMVTAIKPAAVTTPRDPSRVALLKHVAKADLTVFQTALPALQSAYEKASIDDAEYFRYFDAFGRADADLLPQLDAWIEREPKNYSARIARAELRTHLGWLERGGNYANDVPKRKWLAMEKWHRLAAEDLRASVDLSTRPTLSIIKLLGITLSYSLLEPQAAALFEQGERLDPQSRYLYDQYQAHQYGEWGGKAGGADALLARAKKNGVDPEILDQMERHLHYLRQGRETRWDPRAAIAMAIRYSEQKPTVDAWLWRAKVETEHGLYADAEKSINRVLAMAPENEAGFEKRGYIREMQGNLAGARADYERASELGSDYAQDRLIDAYLRTRLGIEKNVDSARVFCEQSAAMLNRAGQFCIGAMYFDGIAGYPRDATEAAKWHFKAARNGHAIAQHDIGWMLVTGKGVEKDRAEGVYWLRESARQDFQYAEAKLRQLGEPLEASNDSGIKALVRKLLSIFASDNIGDVLRLLYP